MTDLPSLDILGLPLSWRSISPSSVAPLAQRLELLILLYLWGYYRWHTEETFLDDQSSGWNLQESEIRSVCDLSRLCFILAVATLYVTAQGVQVVESGKRRWVDVHWFRGNSYFRIGVDWVRSALLDGWRLIHTVRFHSNHDPEPAMASRSQHIKRAHRLEFQPLTRQFVPD